MTVTELLGRLLALYGPQDWWPGESAFEVAVGAILTQRTSWRNAARAIENLRAAGRLKPEAILESEEGTLHELLNPCGFYRLKARRLVGFCRWLNGRGGFGALRAMPTPALREALLDLHGIGPETADAILLYACGRPVFVADAYAFRVLGRLGVSAPRAGRTERRAGGRKRYETLREQVESSLGAEPHALGELHALIVRHGQTVCRPRPLCGRCDLRAHCAAAENRGLTPNLPPADGRPVDSDSRNGV